MILKQLRLSRHLSQEQLAILAGLSVRTIQRIENGHCSASLESLKSLAAALEVDINTLHAETFAMDKTSTHWQQLPTGLKWLFQFNILSLRPQRQVAVRVEFISQLSGFVFCLLGLVNEAALAGGLLLLANAWLFRLHIVLADRYQAWFEPPAAAEHTE